MTVQLQRSSLLLPATFPYLKCWALEEPTSTPLTRTEILLSQLQLRIIMQAQRNISKLMVLARLPVLQNNAKLHPELSFKET